MKIISAKAVTRLAATAAVVALGTTPAMAEGSSAGNNQYDGADPAATGCNQNASLIGTRPVTTRDSGQQVATVEIYYSWSCETNWIRVDGNPYGGNTTKNIFSSLGGYSSEADEGSGSSYSMMVYAPGSTAIDVQVYLFEPGINEWNWKAQAEFSM